MSIRLNLAATAPALLGLLLVSGCGSEGYPEDLRYQTRTSPLVTEYATKQPTRFDVPGSIFHLLDNPDSGYELYKDEKSKNFVLFPGNIKPARYDQIGPVLEKLFGTPAEPKVEGIDNETRKALKLGEKTLARGSQLYRIHCLHCHGVTGDGRGPTAAWVNPHPRDYRQGIFKFTSSKQDLGVRKPRRADLLRTLREGIEGTSMPAFDLLETTRSHYQIPGQPASDVPRPGDTGPLHDLVSYVIHLSLRGETEFLIMKSLLAPDSEVGKLEPAMRGWVKELARRWVDAESPDNLIAPPADHPYPYPVHLYDDPDGQLKESVQNGQRIFKDPKLGGCIGCHFDYGRQTNLFFDAWGTIVRPLDLTRGVYRGGRRPIDLYRRIYGGINGSGMAALLDVPGETDAQKQKRLWDLVNFVQVIPYKAMHKKYAITLD